MSMTLAKAAEVWIKAKKAEDSAKATKDVAADILKDHFRKTNRQSYKSRAGRIGLAVTSRTRLDTQKVKQELGDRLPRFQTTQTYETLSLLEDE